MHWICTLTLLPVLFVSLIAQDVPPKTEGEADAQALVQKLGSTEFTTRDEAMNQLRALGARAKAALEAGSKSDNLETSTRCRMLLKELSGDVATESPLRELREQARPQGGGPHTTSTSVRITPERKVQIEERSDGSVKLTITKLKSGDADAVRTFEAASREEFSQKYPREYSEHLLHGMDPIQFLPPWPPKGVPDIGRWPGEVPELRDWPFHLWPRGVQRPEQRELPAPTESKGITGPRLGVKVEPAGEELCTHLEIPAGTLRVVEVLSGSAAGKLGVKVHDLLLKVDDTDIASVDDILRTLRREAPDEMTVTLLRKGQRLVLKGPRAH